MLRHHLWLVLLIYAVFAVGVEKAMYYAGIGTAVIVLVQLLMSLLIGIEAATLRRFALTRRGWRNVGIVSGDDVEDAELRFFDAGVGTASAQRPAAATPAAPPPRVSQAPDIVGLFPDPGANQ